MFKRKDNIRNIIHKFYHLVDKFMLLNLESV